VNAAADAMVFIPRHNRPRLRHVGDVEATFIEFSHEAHGAHRVVAGDVVGDPFQVGFGRAGDVDLHSDARPVLWYLASSRETTSDMGLTRPFSASSRPRAKARSSTESRASRSWIRRMPS